MSQSSPSVDKTSVKDLYAIQALRQRAGQITRVKATTTPFVQISTPFARSVDSAPLLLLPGSYNPPTTAHLALAQASLQAIPQANLYLGLGTTIINKEQQERATLLDRLILLDQIARRTRQMGILLTNEGLYVGQARAARIAFPQASEVVFVVGFDKIEQIFDARYYQDRDAALQELFALASFLVAPRADHEAADVAALLHQPENQPFQAGVYLLPFPAEYRAVASSEIRAAFQAHSDTLPASPLARLLPPEALAFAVETDCYSPPQALPGGEVIDRYEMRITLIQRALALPEAEQSALDLQRLFHLATSASVEGRTLRCWLSHPASALTPQDLLQF